VITLRLKASASLLSQVGGKVAMDLTMPTMLAWVLGGNADKLRFQDRAPHCRLPDKPKTFHEKVLLDAARSSHCLHLHAARSLRRTAACMS
jgi:hypothetical protein